MLIQSHWLRLLAQNSTATQKCRPAAVLGTARRRCLVQPLTVAAAAAASPGPQEQGKARGKRQKSSKTTKGSGRGKVQDVQGSNSTADTAADAPGQQGGSQTEDTPVSDQAVAGQTLSDIVPVPARGQPNFPDAPFKLRPYQLDAIHNVIKAWKRGSNAQMVMLPTGCGKTVVFAALARYMTQHYVPMAANTAASESAAGAAPETAGGPAGFGSTSAQHRGGPTIAAASTEGTPTAEAGQVDGEGSDAGNSTSYGTSYGGTSSEGSIVESDSGEDALLSAAPSRLQRIQQALKGSSSSKSAQSLHDGGSTGSRAAGMQQDGRRADTVSTSGSGSSTSPSTPNTVSSTARSTPTSSNEEDGGSKRTPGKRRKARQQQPQQEQQPEVQRQVASAGSMRVLVLAHRHELLHQAEGKFRLMWGADDLTVSWVKGKRKEFEGQVVVASAATAVNCIPALRECNFSLVVVDEAHHTVANTYKAILEGLGFIEEVPAPPSEQQSEGSSPNSSRSSTVSSAPGSLESVDEAEGEYDVDSADADWRAAGANSSESEDSKPKTVVRVIPNPNQLLLGFTATPYRLRRSESEDLYAIFRMSYARSISDMIRDRYLTEIKSTKILTQTDLKGAGGGSKGDFILSKLSPLVNSRTRNKLVLAAYLEHCTEPADHGPGRIMDQRSQHEQLAEVRARHVNVAFATKARRNAAKEEQKVQELQDLLLSRSAAAAADSSSGGESASEGATGMLNSFDSLASLSDDDSDDEDEEEEELLMWPLPEDVTAAQITGGLSMAGRKAVRKTVAFAVDIKHAEAMNAVFNAAGVRASAIHSLMPYDVLKSELARFRSGDLEVLFNVEVLTEGFDEPSIDAILMARPTKSAGLYTQMLGRGLRIMPGKTDCLVLDFTDEYNQAGKVVDLRVLVDEFVSPPPFEGPTEKGPARIDEDAVGGEVDVVERGLDPNDLAWCNLGPHCMASIFSSGNVWLVNVGGMGPTQRDKLGLEVPSPAVQRRAQQAVDIVSQGVGAEDEEDSDDDDSMEDRYVILHQDDQKNNDPISWRVGFSPQSHTWKGFSKEDAYGAALAYIDTFVRREQASAVHQFVRAKRTGQKPTKPFIHLNSFKQDAPWRAQPASDKQLQMLKKLEIHVGKSLTKGEASDLISAHRCGLADPTQLLKLQAALGPKAFADLPTPLLKAHADELLKAAQLLTAAK